MTHVYKYPGDDIEYLEGKRYDVKVIAVHEIEAHLKEGWSLTTAEAEEKSKPKRTYHKKGDDDGGLQ
jgi:hypothetical protein